MKTPFCPLCSRRRFLTQVTLGAAPFFTIPGAFAEALTLTPPQTEGPFYPDKLPLDTDNDLLRINDTITPAVGEISHLTGVVSDVNGNPLRNVVVEIWQADQHGSYIHSRGMGREDKRDDHFQGYGRFLTDSKGRYYFRTIKPVAYVGRAPHIHVAVVRNNEKLLTTQCYIKGHELNENDGVVRSISDAKQKESVMIPFEPLEGSTAGELTAKFDIVIGMTPPDPGH